MFLAVDFFEEGDLKQSCAKDSSTTAKLVNKTAKLKKIFQKRFIISKF
jgi:hypothetical protein